MFFLVKQIPGSNFQRRISLSVVNFDDSKYFQHYALNMCKVGKLLLRFDLIIKMTYALKLQIFPLGPRNKCNLYIYKKKKKKKNSRARGICLQTWLSFSPLILEILYLIFSI